jgi:hypothetical protein
LTAGALRKQLESVSEAAKNDKVLASLVKDCGGESKVFFSSSKDLIESILGKRLENTAPKNENVVKDVNSEEKKESFKGKAYTLHAASSEKNTLKPEIEKPMMKGGYSKPLPGMNKAFDY